MIAYNNGTLRTDFKNIYYNNGTLRDVKQVWWNVNGTPKLVWPDGVYTNHRDWFNGGVYHTDGNTSSHGWVFSGAGSVGSNDFSFSATEYRAYDSDRDNSAWAWAYPWFLTKEKVNLSLYSSLEVTFNYQTFPQYSGKWGEGGFYFITADANTLPVESNNWGTPTAIKNSIKIFNDWTTDNRYDTTTKTVDIKSLTGTVYVGFQIHGYCSDGYGSGYGVRGSITKIQFKR